MNIFQKLKEKHHNNTRRLLERRVNAMFQIKERDGELWLTYEGFFVCPCAMLKDSPVESVRKMRVLYKCHLDNA